MASEIKVNKITTSSGSTLEFGGAGDTVSVGSGATTTGFGGKVLQVLSMTYSTETYSTSATFADTGLTLAITPSATSSKVFVLAQIKVTAQDNSSTRGGKAGLQILKDSSIIYGPINTGIYLGGPSSVNRQSQNWNQLQFLDSPSTTSATTYKLQFNCPDDGAWANADGEMGIFTLMEIGA